MDSACPDCPIGGRDGNGPVCPHVAACDRQCAEMVAVHDVRCGLRRDLMEAAGGYTDTLSPLETIRQRWARYAGAMARGPTRPERRSAHRRDDGTALDP